MGVDKSYGSGYKNTGMKKPVAPKAASAKLRKKGIKTAAKKYTSITTSKAKMLPGTSDYVAQENAARKQLGVAGLAARNRQLPTAARAFTKEMTGIDISRKGVSVDPAGLAISIPTGGVGGALLRGGARLIPKALRISKAAERVARVAGRAANASAEEIRLGRSAQSRLLANSVASGKEAAKSFRESERAWGTSAATMWGGSEGAMAQRAYRSYDKPIEEVSMTIANAARRNERSIGRATAPEAAAEIRRRLAALKRAKRQANRNR